jgi:ribonuclease P protein component
MAKVSLIYPPLARLRKRKDFIFMRHSSTRFSGQFLQIDYKLHPRRLSNSPRLGITVSKQYGKAHDRNRFKRLVREAFRHCMADFPKALDLHVLPKKEVRPASFSHCSQDFHALLSFFHSQ